MNTLGKIAPTIITLAFLAAAADVIIFHRENTAKVLRARVASIPLRVFEFAVALLTGLALLGLLIMICLLVSSVASTARYLWEAPAQSYDGLTLKDRIIVENALRTNRIQVVTTGVQALGGIAVLIGIYFAWANLKTTQRGQRETLRLTNEGQITDRFTKAIDQLGATDDKGNPRMELRLGGIYALERIARDSEKDHWPVVEVLIAYIRAHSMSTPGVDHMVLAQDILAILTVIGRRARTYGKGEDAPLDLAGVNLNFVNLNRANLKGANLLGANLKIAKLLGANLSGANLTHANLRGANLTAADLGGANLNAADLGGASLLDANLTGVGLYGANLGGADLFRTHLNGAHLTDADLSGASLYGADLSSASLLRANLSGADLGGADLGGADLGGADIASSIGLTQSQVNSARGDKDTKLPSGIAMPESWNISTAALTEAPCP